MNSPTTNNRLQILNMRTIKYYRRTQTLDRQSFVLEKPKSLDLILSSFHRSIIKAKHSSLAFPQNCGVWVPSSTTHVQISTHYLAWVFSFSTYSKVFATYLKPCWKSWAYTHFQTQMVQKPYHLGRYTLLWLI